jgi:hypothetical protein
MLRYNTDYERFLARGITLTRYEANNRRNLEFTIDLEYVTDLYRKQEGKCALTGWTMQLSKGTNNSRTNPYVCTMDRIEQDKGYIPGNIQLTCWLPNKIKSSLGNNEFISLCGAISATHKSKIVDE